MEAEAPTPELTEEQKLLARLESMEKEWANAQTSLAVLGNDMAWVKDALKRESERNNDRGPYKVTSRALIVVGISLVIVASVLGVRLPGWLGFGAQPAAVSAPHRPLPNAPDWPRSNLYYDIME